MNVARRCTTILGARIDCVSLGVLLRALFLACETRQGLHVVTTSIHFLSVARNEPDFLSAINASDFVVADGKLVQWLTYIVGQPAPEQITGHAVFEAVMNLAKERPLRILLLGGGRNVASDVASKHQVLAPRSEIVGWSGGEFSPNGSNADNDALLETIKTFDPHVLFVALGAPKQELWIYRNRKALSGCVAIGVGNVFDTQVGILPTVPKALYQAGLGSVAQLMIAPKRYWRRYLLEDPPTLARALVHAIGKRIMCSMLGLARRRTRSS